jgi:hypothetical protein
VPSLSIVLRELSGAADAAGDDKCGWCSRRRDAAEAADDDEAAGAVEQEMQPMLLVMMMLLVQPKKRCSRYCCLLTVTLTVMMLLMQTKEHPLLRGRARSIPTSPDSAAKAGQQLVRDTYKVTHRWFCHAA